MQEIELILKHNNMGMKKIVSTICVQAAGIRFPFQGFPGIQIAIRLGLRNKHIFINLSAWDS